MSIDGKNAHMCDAPIPLLINKHTMQETGVVLDMRDDTVFIHGRRTKLEQIEAQHYALKLKFSYRDSNKANNLSEKDSLSREEFQVL